MRRYFIAAVLACSALTACGTSPATTFLALEPIPPMMTSAYRGPPVRIPFLRVPVILDRPEFVRQVASTVEVSDFNRWAAPLGRLARDTLIQDLQARLPAGTVLPPDAGAVTPEVRAEATVLSFAASGGEAQMNVSYRIVPASMSPGLSAEAPPRPITLRTPLLSDDPVSQARAWSALLGQLADRIAADVTAN